jgi:hypothetical protein
MTAQTLTSENRGTNELSDTDLDLAAGGHHHNQPSHNGGDVFAAGFIGGLAVVVGTVIVIGLL